MTTHGPAAERAKGRATASWPPSGLGDPRVSGMSNGLRYAWFERARRLAVADGSAVRLYSTAGLSLGGFAVSDDGELTFLCGTAWRELSTLRHVSEAALAPAPTGR